MKNILNKLKPLNTAGVTAEYEKANTILVQRPSLEMFFGSLYYPIALYEGPLNRRLAAMEHDNYTKLLRNKGINVLDINTVLLDGLINDNGSIVENSDLDKLRDLASDSMNLVRKNLNLADRKAAEKMKQYSIMMMDPKDIINVILSQPDIETYYSDEKNCELEGKISFNPLYNQCFFRDQQITTDKGIVIGKMNSKQRQNETELTKLGFEKLGIRPIYEVKNNGRLEGGDFMPAGDHAFLGMGLRTNEQGVKQLLENKVFGYKRIVVVKDVYKDQEEMHLDTYFNIYDYKKAFVLNDRIEQKSNSLNKVPKVDIYKLQPDESYTKSVSDMNFKEFLINEGYSLSPISKNLQLSYGINFLTVNPGEIIGVNISEKKSIYEKIKSFEPKIGSINYGAEKNYAQLGADYVKILEQSNISLNKDSSSLISFNNLNMAYGGPHCLTQVISRGD